MNIEVRRLDSGHYHLRGDGPCNWAQVAKWPCSLADLEEGTFPEAGQEFRRDAADALFRAQFDSDWVFHCDGCSARTSCSDGAEFEDGYAYCEDCRDDTDERSDG